MSAPYGQTDFTSENFPGSVQTQVTGINNIGETCGFEIDAAGNSLGFVRDNGRYIAAIDPSALAAGGAINEAIPRDQRSRPRRRVSIPPRRERR